MGFEGLLMMDDKEMYGRLAWYYTETTDTLSALKDEEMELLSEEEKVPQMLKNEITRHQFIISILTQLGEEKYSKSPKSLYQDGWNFWFKEDAELREKRYSSNN
jgi:hypothetical protein